MAGGKIVEISTPKELKLESTVPGNWMLNIWMMDPFGKSTFSLDGLGNNNEFMDIIKRGRY